MHNFRRLSMALIMSAAISAPALIAGCSGHVRYYDATYGDYHPWDHNEAVFYGRWEGDTHRSHVEFKDRNSADQAEYWKWRHSQH
jgi:hypothetical protein